MPRGDQDRVFDGPERAAVTDPRLQTLVLRSEVGVLGSDRGQGRLLRARSEALLRFAGASGAAFAGGLVVAEAASGPRDEMSSRGEGAHVADNPRLAIGVLADFLQNLGMKQCD